MFDIARHACSLGFFDLAKITGTDTATEIWTCDTVKRTVVLEGKIKNPIPELNGEVGLGNLSFFNGLTSLYNKEGSEVKVLTSTKNGNVVPDYIQFTDNEGNNDKYRLMSKEIIDEQLEVSQFKGTKWDISFEPSKAKVSEFAAKSTIYSGLEPTFTVKVENGDLIFTFGSDIGGSHFGRMVFARNIPASLTEGYAWPIDKFLSIVKLGMAADCTVHFNKIACMITIDTGIAVYNYILPGHSR
jgi:hypothetical protein